MADKDTGMILFGMIVILGLGFLFWKVTSADKTTVTSFIRDEQGRITEIIERAT